jgi:predicted nucleic acid-binding Zn ribbon protein
MAEQLARILDNIDGGMGRTIRNCHLLSLWGRVVDERVGKHTEPLKIKGQVLYVLTSSPTWAQELSFFKREFVERFNREAGEQVIRDIRFK